MYAATGSPLGKERVVETERGSTRSHSKKNSLWKRLWTSRKTTGRMTNAFLVIKCYVTGTSKSSNGTSKGNTGTSSNHIGTSKGSTGTSNSSTGTSNSSTGISTGSTGRLKTPACSYHVYPLLKKTHKVSHFEWFRRSQSNVITVLQGLAENYFIHCYREDKDLCIQPGGSCF